MQMTTDKHEAHDDSYTAAVIRKMPTPETPLEKAKFMEMVLPIVMSVKRRTAALSVEGSW